MAASLSFWQHLQSFLYPVSIRKGSSALNPVLELFYFRGRYILATQDAVYSDGNKYRPLLKAFESPFLKPKLAELKNVLVLGTGLASAVHILDAKGLHPQVRLVEIDPLVLEWAAEFLPMTAMGNVKAINADAFDFIVKDAGLYDLIIVDIFFGRAVPEAVEQSPFLTQCREHKETGGILILNYMEPEHGAANRLRLLLQGLFADVAEISFGINRVFVCR